MKLGREFNIFLFSINLLLKRKSSYYIFLILTVLVFLSHLQALLLHP